jgi:UDP-glucose:(heptosyl)LPS alpha-1,3-glucosyltransferase
LLSRGLKRRKLYNSRVKKCIQKLKPDLVIGHGDIQHQDILSLHNCVHLTYEKIYGKPISSGHEMHKIHYPILQNQQFKHLIANSELMKRDLIDRYRIPSEKISVIYPVFNESQFFPLEKGKIRKIRRNLGANDDEFMVGLITSGDFTKRGLDRFLRACDLLPRSTANKIHFIFVGKDKLSEECQKLLNKSKYEDRIRIFPIIDNVQEYYNALDVFVLPARIEEFGRVVLEAMACRCPVITTRWVGASELMQGKSRDFIYQGDNDQELANLIEKLLCDVDLRREVGELNLEASEKGRESRLKEKFDRVFLPFIS